MNDASNRLPQLQNLKKASSVKMLLNKLQRAAIVTRKS